MLDVEESHGSLCEADRLDLLIRHDAALQMTHLQAQPDAVSRLAAGKLQPHG